MNEPPFRLNYLFEKDFLSVFAVLKHMDNKKLTQCLWNDSELYVLILDNNSSTQQTYTVIILCVAKNKIEKCTLMLELQLISIKSDVRLINKWVF